MFDKIFNTSCGRLIVVSKKSDIDSVPRWELVKISKLNYCEKCYESFCVLLFLFRSATFTIFFTTNLMC